MSPTKARRKPRVTAIRRKPVVPARQNAPADLHLLQRDWQQLALVAVLVVSAFFRIAGRDWDRGASLHRVERSFATVAGALNAPLRDPRFLGPDHSTLNRDRDDGTFGTLP